jgi:Zn-dependent M28 family amino/carboxypeptidase
VVNAEHYNRLVRLAQGGEQLRMALQLDARYHTDDLMAYNTVAEIPGSDLRDELVMLGGHMDSWHGGTGATDNAAGVAVCMEAVRILQAVGLKPRRTIRIALWSGEEQGLLGSRAYVTKHFGYYTNLTAQQLLDEKAESPKDRERSEERLRSAPAAERNRTTRKFVAGPEHGRISAYFNLDNGGGKVRGIYLQGNEAARPIFRRWLAPFADLGAETITAQNTGGTDHQSFDGAGVPGFQFIQDGMDYWTLTHHSNMDVFDRLVPDDMKQASVLMAAFVYHAAMADEKIPRKPERPEERPDSRRNPRVGVTQARAAGGAVDSK